VQLVKQRIATKSKRALRTIGSGLIFVSIVCLQSGSALAGECDLGTCDFDFNADGTVDVADAELLRAAFGSEPGDPGYIDAFDADADGVIGGTDWAAFVDSLGGQ